ncbi:hypothetical protein BD414DRAFT_26481 [Trametes punicea]|nr:hypothetical protein BD414DRAFT_26481 [Trametes punicea]
MAQRCLRKFRLASTSSFAHVCHLHSTTARQDALVVPPADASSSSIASSSSSSSSPVRESPLVALRKERIADLRNLLSLKSPSPHRVWASYVDLLQYCRASNVPLDIHQGVLHKCAPSPAFLRDVSAKMMEKGGRFKDDQLYEARFRDVIRNIRAAGHTPALDDYHRVLELFAAVGNYRSAMMVLEEIGQVRLQKEPETYGLCLQALAHRLTLPIWHLDRPILVNEVTAHCRKILEEMSLYNTSYTSRNVDLAFRILKETLSMEGFSVLMKGAYGIDLSYPDRSPLQFWEPDGAAPTTDDAQENITSSLRTRLPFSLAAFNTALDYLGRAGEVSKMIQLFEVVTNPLPASASNHSFEDDDDDDFGYSNPQVAPYNPPHVQPNTTTFHILLRSLHKAQHAVLARHYLLIALEMERNEARQLRELVRTKPPDEIAAPRLAITRSLLLPVFSIANDNKNVELLRWVVYKTRRAVKWKRRYIEYYEQVRARWTEEGLYQPPVLTEAELDASEDLPLGPSSSRFSTFFDPSSSLRSPSVDTNPSAQAPPIETKPFNIDFHINLIRRDLDRLIKFETHVEAVFGRTLQRIKERLGRRVWVGKNVFLRDTGRRLQVSKEFWRMHVNYRPQIPSGQAASSGGKPREVSQTEAPSSRQSSTPLLKTATLGSQYLRANASSTASKNLSES